jgi:hypothetical protein
MNEKIRLIRLTSGEEILVTILKENEVRKFVKNPILLIPDREKIGFIPYMSYCEIDELMIKEEHIMFNVKPSDELTEQYKNMIDGPNKIQTLKILT